MLQTQTVNGATLELLKSLMATLALQQFDLVGGTNLALRLGHRLSIDLDLFTAQAFEVERLARTIIAQYPNTILCLRYGR